MLLSLNQFSAAMWADSCLGPWTARSTAWHGLTAMLRAVRKRRVGQDRGAGAGPPLPDDGGPSLAKGELVPPYKYESRKWLGRVKYSFGPRLAVSRQLGSSRPLGISTEMGRNTAHAANDQERQDFNAQERQALDACQSAAERQETAELDWCDIRSTLEGDGQAYARIVRRYQDQITTQIWRLSRRPADCEQLVHDVFVEAYLSLKHFQGRAPLLHWLRKIATRVGYRYWKQQARLRRQATVPLEDWHKSSPVDDSVDVAEAAGQVHALLAQLPPRDRLVLTLIYLDGCSVAEAAERAGWSQTMTKVQAHRARKKLKKLLEQVPDTQQRDAQQRQVPDAESEAHDA